MNDITLLPVPLDVLRLLAFGDLAAAGRRLGIPMPPELLDDQWVWQRFVTLCEEHPDDAEWFTQMLVLDRVRVVGHVRFVGPPLDGCVEAGYLTFPSARGRGVATTALRLLLRRAADAGVGVVIARISPDNGASRAVARKAGFVDVGLEDHPRQGVPMRRLEVHTSTVGE